METKYKLTLYYPDGHTEYREFNGKEEQKAKDYAWEQIEKDPEVCVNLITSHFDTLTPNKESVKLRRFEMKEGKIQTIDY